MHIIFALDSLLSIFVVHCVLLLIRIVLYSRLSDLMKDAYICVFL